MNPPITRAALLAGAALFAVPLHAQSGQPAAQRAPPADEANGEEEEEIVVTGVRRGAVVGDIPPEDTLDARDVRATGATNISELLQALAPQIGSARGRGGDAPVLLLDGRRISGFRELRDIPTEAIQRVEILPEEVALKYGYRADQRVVNIVLRPRFRSTVAQVGGNVATEGGYGGANGDLTRLILSRDGRTALNLRAETNSMLTEAERDIVQSDSAAPDARGARSLVGSRRLLRGTATYNRQILGDVAATGNAELSHSEGRSLIGLSDGLLGVLDRDTQTDSAHLGGMLNGDKQGWRWTVTGNADLARSLTGTDRDNPDFPRDRARQTSASGDLTATANGKLFALPAGNAGLTLRTGARTVHVDNERRRAGAASSTDLARTAGTAAFNLDLPVSRRGRDFSGLGNLTLNANAEVEQLSDFGTLATIGAGANWSPVDRLTFLTSWSREEGAPTIAELGDPLLETPGSRIFDFTRDETAFVTAITGGNPDLQADRRNVFKLGANWQPLAKLDLRLRADYVHSDLRRPVSAISVTPAIEAAFPERFVRDSSGSLVNVDLRPVNFDSARRETLRIGFDFTRPLRSRRPSAAVLDQLRAQFGRGRRGAPGAPPQDGPPPAEGPGVGPGPEAGERRGRGFGGGGGFFGGGNRGRIQFSLTDTITLTDEVTIRPGLAKLDYLDGEAVGSTGGRPRHQVEAQAGWFNNGFGARLSANWRSATRVDSLTGDDLRFSSLGTFDLRLFANLGEQPELVIKQPWLRGTSLRLELTNIFDAKPRVRDAAGAVPLSYQPDLLDPVGRRIMISFRKLFAPSPAALRRQFEQERRAR